MNVVLHIDGREAIPVRALANVLNYGPSPHAILDACCKESPFVIEGMDSINRAYLASYIITDNAAPVPYRRMEREEWRPFLYRVENLAAEEAIDVMPDGVFVWLDDLTNWYAYYLVTHEFVIDYDGSDYKDDCPETLIPNVDPHVATKRQQWIFEGFPSGNTKCIEKRDLKCVGNAQDEGGHRGNVSSNRFDWREEARKLAQSIGQERWDEGMREITARNVSDAVSAKLAKDTRSHGQRGLRVAGTIRSDALKGWKFIPQQGVTSGTTGTS